MEACAKAKFQRYGSRKVNLVLDQIRGKNVKAAEDMLPFIAKRTADLGGQNPPQRRGEPGSKSRQKAGLQQSLH